MLRGVFLKIFLWFAVSLVLVALALDLAITATSTPAEVRVHRFSDNALSTRAREAVTLLDRDGAAGVRRYFDELERATQIHAVLLDPSGHQVAGRTVPETGAAVAARAIVSGVVPSRALFSTTLKFSALS